MEHAKTFSVRECVVEAADVVAIAKLVIRGIDDTSDRARRELKQALANLNQAEYYIERIKKGIDIMMPFVPADVQKKKNL